MIDATRMRMDILRMARAAGSNGAHLGGSLSAVEIIAALYDGVMRFDPGNPAAEDRDRFILSKGHGVIAQYAALRQLGMISEEEIDTFKSDGTRLFAHPSMDPGLGVEFSCGSLGQGLSLGVGVALALRRKQCDAGVYVLLGDGECDEGQIWEAALAASGYALGNLIAVIDRNRLQYDGDTEEVLPLADLSGKWAAFGWRVATCDGHDRDALVRVLTAPHDGPLAVVAETVKGKGVSFMEHLTAWHNGVLTRTLYEQAVAELEGQR